MGRVRSLRRDPPLCLKSADCHGYRLVILWKEGKQSSALIHRLVAREFIGEPPTPGHTVNHKDYDKANNFWTNLEWMEHADNVRYSKDVIPRNRGEANRSKLKESQVRDIRGRHASGSRTLTQLANEFGVSVQTCSAIVRRKKWAHVV